MSSFRLMPGPPCFPLIGSLPLYFGPNAIYSLDSLHKNGFIKQSKYGNVVREKLGPTSIVWLFDPDDISHMLRSESERPRRRSHLALDHYRSQRKDLYNDGGLLPTNGLDWARVRRQAQRLFTVQRINEFAHMELLTHDFVQLSARVLQTKPDIDWVEHLKRFFLELIGQFVFDLRLGAISRPELDEENESVIRATEMVNSNILITDNSIPTWKIVPNKHYRQFKEGMQILERFAMKYWDYSEGSFGRELDKKDALALVIDTVLAAIDTSSYTAAFALYHLSRNPWAQTLVRSESGMAWMRCVLKESLRLNPVSVGIGRISEQEIVLGGYQVPPKTVLVTQNQVSCQLSEFVTDRPTQFLPQRWQRDDKGQLNTQIHPFLVLPFGHGARMCLGRRLAEQSITALIHALINNFHFEWLERQGDVDCVSKLINVPSKPIKMNVKPL